MLRIPPNADKMIKQMTIERQALRTTLTSGKRDEDLPPRITYVFQFSSLIFKNLKIENNEETNRFLVILENPGENIF